ncbi:MAG: hypothetical protein AB1801_08895 [Chloroflexota bacterium]
MKRQTHTWLSPAKTNFVLFKRRSGIDFDIGRACEFIDPPLPPGLPKVWDRPAHRFPIEQSNLAIVAPPRPEPVG